MAYSTISKPSLHFNTKLYTGTGSSNAQTGVGFQPDLIWFKNRTSTYWHQLYDVVRGVNKSIASNATNVQENRTDNLNSFDTDGFTVGAEGGDKNVNYSGDNYASWNWKAGTAFTNDASSTGIGTIDSSGSVNTSAGFSICSWVGTGSNGTIKHGLSTVPEMMIIKNTGHDTNWSVYTKPTGRLGELRLNSTDAFVDDATLYNDTAPTSSVFSVGTNYNTNHSDGRTYIGYIFSSVQGYSKIGLYTGNGNADGTFVYTGFKPAFVIYKRYDSGAYSWVLVDNKRGAGSDELIKKYFHPNSNAAEASTTLMDFLSNGFKLKVNDTTSNQGSIVYMAFAEEPLVANVGASIPATAR